MLMKLFMWYLQAVKTGDTIFVGQYLFTGSETTSVWLEVRANFFLCNHSIFFVVTHVVMLILNFGNWLELRT